MNSLCKVPVYRIARSFTNVSSIRVPACSTFNCASLAAIAHGTTTVYHNSQRAFSVKPLNVGGMSNDLLVSLSMNYNNSGSNHTELCDNLRRNNLLSTPLLEYSFRKADRAIFDPSEVPYEDKPHSIGGGATITSAHMHAIALESIAGAMIPDTPSTSLSFLDVGSGSGYVTGVMGMLIHTMTNSAANKEHNNGNVVGHVTGVDIVPQLVEQSARNLRALLPALASTSEEVQENPICSVMAIDAFKEDVPKGPFDAIHVGVAAVGTPYRLLSQLKKNGKAVVPIYIQGTPEQDLIVFTRKSDESIPSSTTPADLEAWSERVFAKKTVMRCMYSPPMESASVPQDAAIDPRGDTKTAADSKFAKFFKNDTVRETPEAAAQRRKQAKAQEMSELRLRMTTDLETQTKALDVTAEEVKAWHTKFFEVHGRKPLMAEMKEDAVMQRLLTVVHDLRKQIQKNERGLKALNQ